MQIVIDIPDAMYEDIESGKYGYSNYVHTAIANGTPLPKGHGCLVDISKIEYLKAIHDAKYGKISWSDAIEQIINSAPTIIEADKESEEISDTNLKMWEEIFKAESEE